MAVINARDIRNGWGLNGITGDASGATALNTLNCRWVRADMKSTGANAGNTPPNGTGGAQGLAAAMVAAAMYDPNPKYQVIIDDYFNDQWSWNSQQTFLAAALPLINQNGKKLFAAIEGPNEMGSSGNGGGSIGVNLTALIVAGDNQTGSAFANTRLLWGQWAQAIAVHRSLNDIMWAGVELISPTILEVGQGGATSTRAPSGLPGDWEATALPSGAGLGISGLVDYGNIHYYTSNSGGGVGSPSNALQTTFTGYQQSFDRYYNGFKSGISQGSGNISLVVSETGQNTSTWSPDGISAAWTDMAILLDTFALGGHRVTYYTATGNGLFNWFNTYPTGITPRGIALANISTLLSLGNSYATAANLPTTDIVPIIPAYDGSAFTMTFLSGAAPQLGNAGSFIICPKSDGSTMIPIWREPDYDDGSKTNTIHGTAVPPGSTFTINFGSVQTFNIWDPMGATGGTTRAITSTPVKLSGPVTAASVNLTLFASPLFIELLGTTITLPPDIPTTPVIGTVTATSIQMNWIVISGIATTPTSYVPQLSINGGSTYTDVATLGMVGTYTYNGIVPSSTVLVRIKAVNSFGSATSSPVSVTALGASGNAFIPTIVRSNSFRSDGPNSPASITLSFTSQPLATSSVWVFFNGFAGTGNNSSSILAPPGSILISGPNYDSLSEVTWCWNVPNTTPITNSWTFTNFDNHNNAGWTIIEVNGLLNALIYDTTHGAVSSVTSTAIGWPIKGETFTNALRLSLLSLQHSATIGAGSSGISLVKADPASITFHQGVLVSELGGTTPVGSSGSLAITGGIINDTNTYLNLQLYGAPIPNQVGTVTTSSITSTSISIGWPQVASALSYTAQISANNGLTYTTFATTTSTTTTTATGLAVNATYLFKVAANNASGQGLFSLPVSAKTLVQNSLLFIQGGTGQDTNGGAGIIVTLPNPTTIGNTLLFYLACDNTNVTLVAPPGATNIVPITQNVGTIGGELFWTMENVTTSAISFTAPAYKGTASFSVEEYQGVTGFANLASSSALTFVESPLSVTVPIVQATTTPALGLYFVNMRIAPASYGVMPTGIKLLQGSISSGPGAAVLQAFVLESTAPSGNSVIPMTAYVRLGARVPQNMSPMYVGINLLGSSVATPPGASVASLGTATLSTQIVNWSIASGTVNSYLVRYSTAQNMLNAASMTIAAPTLTATIPLLSPGTNYFYTVQAFNGTTPGAISNQVSGNTLTAGIVRPILIGGKPLVIGGKAAVA